jgi:alkyl hydroperoxide reductase subunit F
MYDLIIIGGGPAGLTATIYAVRKNIDVLLISKDLGGKANYRMQLPSVRRHLVIRGEEVVSRFANEVEYLDFARVLDGVEKIEKIDDGFTVLCKSGERYVAKAVILATGASPKFLGIPGEDKFIGRGLSYSAVSYAPLFRERTTVVVGDGLLALRAAAELAQSANVVTLVAPTRGELDSPLGRRLMAHPRVTILEGCEPLEVKGDEFARELIIKQDGKKQTLEADVIFVELGLLPKSDLVEGLVELDKDGRIEVDQKNRTATPGLFAAGDVTTAPAEQILIAVGEGAKAALTAHTYLLELPAESAEAVA